MTVAVIVISVILALALIALFVIVGIKRRQAVTDKNDFEKIEGVQKQSFKEWWQNHKPSKRRLIQVYAALLYNANIKGFITGGIYTGNTKYLCVPGLNCYSCPGAVGACPLGSLQNALRDTNHRAPYYMLGMFALFGLILARTVCGFLCPVGLAQELLYKIRTPKLKKSKATRALSYLKYVILALFVIAIPLIYGLRDMTLPAFCKYICPAGTLGGAIGLLINPANEAMFDMLGPAFTWKFCVLVAACVACVFIYRAFCRFLCPLGALYGFFNRIALLGVKLDSGKCTDCGLCVQHCKMDVKKVGDHECINCGECISVCPAKAISWKGSQIFVRGTADTTPAAEEVKPLAAFINTPAAETTETTEEIAVTGNETKETPVKVKKKRDKKFRIEIGAWALALVLLLAALICYNIDFKKNDNPGGTDASVGNRVGDLCTDFTLDLYQGGGTYNLYGNRGKITLLNFWYVGCGPCEAEMPYIGELSLSEEYDIDIITIHGTSVRSADKFIVEQGWNEYDIKWAQDIIENNVCQIFNKLCNAAVPAYPMTVILDEEGIIRYNSLAHFESYEQLKSVIDGIING